MKTELSAIALKLKAIQEELSNLKPLAEKIRAYYKHQNDET